MTKHKFGYTEEMLQSRLVEWMIEKQEFHEKLEHTKRERTANGLNENTKQLDIIELLNLWVKSNVHKMNNCKFNKKKFMKKILDDRI